MVRAFVRRLPNYKSTLRICGPGTKQGLKLVPKQGTERPVVADRADGGTGQRVDAVFA